MSPRREIIESDDDDYTPRDRDVVVHDAGPGLGTILGVTLAVLLALALIWFLFAGSMVGPGSDTPGGGPSGPSIERPAQPGGGVQPPGGGGVQPGGGLGQPGGGTAPGGSNPGGGPGTDIP